MATRAYRRNSRGQFAGSGGRVTTGKAGGFANAAHRSKAADARASAARKRALVKNVKATAGMLGTLAVSVAVPMAVGAASRAVLGGRQGGLSTKPAKASYAKSRRGSFKITTL